MKTFWIESYSTTPAVVKYIPSNPFSENLQNFWDIIQQGLP